ncbi:hypothetical protein V5R04_09585 [Jonesiaceae bacterium BS-20]|uniref:Gram-positive cocci surface proteins LPxTG domain-containing protein n=1 Tax=Jonesiaceae bacterium BS-20 TaxID=3120821 RepID=A0AAU7DRC7_9MICO
MGTTMAAAPAQAHGNDPRNWDLPAGVVRSNQTLSWTASNGNSGFGGVAPGRTFFYLFELRNDGSEAVTVTGFNSNFVFQMHPDRQGDFALDHCKQFIEDVPGPDRQSFPVVIQPGQAVTISDNATYHYIYGPPSNECQNASFFFGPPVFLTVEQVVPEAPVWHEATCDAGASVVIPEITGVTYAINGTNVDAGQHTITEPQEVTVTAGANDGYEFPAQTITQWQHNVAAPECSTPPTEPEIEEEPGATDGEESPGGPEDVDESATPSDPSVKDPLDTGNDQPANPGDGKLVIDQTLGDTELAATGISENAMLWLAGSMVAGFTGAMLVLRSRKVRG